MMRSVLPYLEILVVCAALAAGVYFYRSEVRVIAAQALFEVAPCSMPVTYSIGSIDPRFGISTSSLARAMDSAASVWNDAAGKDLIAHEPTGGLVTVNLVYDKRQATTQQLGSISDDLSTHAVSYSAVKTQYDAALAAYTAKKTAFDTAYASYADRADEYEREVRQWSEKGGAPSDRYAALRSEKEALDSEARSLEGMQTEVNQRADSVNVLVGELNVLAREVNSDAVAYNTVGRVTGAEFEEAVFESAPGHEEIDVYEYDSIARLTRVLSHEFGHSLGLEHVEDPDAIMYRLNQGIDTIATADDKAELKVACRL